MKGLRIFLYLLALPVVFVILRAISETLLVGVLIYGSLSIILAAFVHMRLRRR